MMRSHPTPTFWSKGRRPHLAVSPHRCRHPATPYSKVCFPLLCFADPLTFGTHTEIVGHATTMSHTGSLSIGAPFFCCIFILADLWPCHHHCLDRPTDCALTVEATHFTPQPAGSATSPRHTNHGSMVPEPPRHITTLPLPFPPATVNGWRVGQT